jgi:hypothetical protein
MSRVYQAPPTDPLTRPARPRSAPRRLQPDGVVVAADLDAGRPASRSTMTVSYVLPIESAASSAVAFAV